MALARTRSVAVLGVQGRVCEVEVHLAQGLPQFTLVGLPDASLAESRDRVRAAVVTSGQPWPAHRITVNLAPASLPKQGSSFDLAIAAAILVAQDVLPAGELADAVLIGELGLDGRLHPVRGVLPSVVAAAEAGVGRVVVPEANSAEARLMPGLEVLGIRSLRQLVALLRGEEIPAEPAAPPGTPAPPTPAASPLDLHDIVGQPDARHALEVAAAGGHHLLLIGAPGVGKTMLAERLPGVLPDLRLSEALEVTSVHSVAGTLAPGAPLVTRPPYQAPHHTASVAAIVGGGSSVLRPGAASLAHRGVLFLDECPEFRLGVLDALRQPLESGVISIARAAAQARYPARFQLVLAANPCPCGMAVGKGSLCTCPPMAKRRYLGRLSGPLLDRVDLRQNLLPPSRDQLSAELGSGEGTAMVAARVHDARARMAHRYRGTPWLTNADVPGHELRRGWPLPADSLAAMNAMARTGALSVRGLDRVVRTAWTIADLDGRRQPDRVDIGRAADLRRGGSSTP